MPLQYSLTIRIDLTLKDGVKTGALEAEVKAANTGEE
jgi:hypothetical protein